MTINLSNYINGNYNTNIVNGTVNLANQNNNSGISAGNLMLQNMLAGETFTGLVLDIKDNQVSLVLSNGASVTANLTDNVDIQSGQNITFMIEDRNRNQISIKALAADEQQSVLINKALDGAGLPVTKDNISIVKELLSLNMPVNSDTINEMIHSATTFPKADYHTLANMVRLEIPITSENIMQYEAYSHFESNMSNNLENIGSELVNEVLNNLNNTEGMNNASQLINGVVDALYNTSGSNIEITSTLMSDLFNNEQLVNIANELSQITGQPNDDLANELKNNEISVKQYIELFLNTDNGADKLNNPAVKSLLKDDSFKAVIHQVICDTMKLTPEDIKYENVIPEFYKRIRKAVEYAASTVEKHAAGTELQKEMTNIKSNIDFMNDLNKNMTFFQMPVKFSESEGNGELYVFTNKKSLKNNKDNISALLHLDMDNMGPMDVYVKLSNNNVTTNFCLESEEMLDFVNEHIEQLNQRLEGLGYATHFEMKVTDSDKDKVDFVEDFLEKDVYVSSSNQYIFDSRV